MISFVKFKFRQDLFHLYVPKSLGFFPDLLKRIKIMNFFKTISKVLINKYGEEIEFHLYIFYL